MALLFHVVLSHETCKESKNTLFPKESLPKEKKPIISRFALCEKREVKLHVYWEGGGEQDNEKQQQKIPKETKKT